MVIKLKLENSIYMLKYNYFCLWYRGLFIEVEKGYLEIEKGLFRRFSG